MFLTTQASDHFAEEIKESATELKLLGNGSVSKHIFSVANELCSLARNHKHVYLIGCQYYVNVVLMVIAMFLKTHFRNIFFINSERNHLSEFSYKPGIKNKLIPVLVKLSYKLADVVIANSDETAKDLGKLIGRKVFSIFNPTINERIELLQGEAINERWFLDDERPCILAVGRLSLQKDYLTLLRAFLKVRKVFDFKLVILGEGDEREALEKFISANNLSGAVYLPGFVPNPYKFMKASQIFVLSSRYEGLPNVLIEAVFLGLPCVSTSCKSGPREILLEGKGGHLVPVGDSEQMAEAIIDTVNNSETTLAMSALAKSRLSRFKPENVVPKFEKAINSPVRRAL